MLPFKGNHEEAPVRRKKGGGVGGFFRLIISLIVLSILGLGLYRAYVTFSGVDPLKLNPKSVIQGALSSESLIDFATGLLTISPGQSVDSAKKLLGDTAGGAAVDEPVSNAPVKYSFAVIADSHLDTPNLTKALNQAKSANVKFVVGMGDFSDVGTLDELRSTKLAFDTVGLPFYVTAGDHDLWDSRDKGRAPIDNFSQVFGPAYQAFTYEDTRIILVYNSDNYVGLDLAQLTWLEEEMGKLTKSDAKQAFVMLATPLYHPSSDHVMGKVNPKLKDQAEHLTSIFKRGGVDEVFAADTHFYSRYVEPKESLKMTTVGAVTSVKNPQVPRFSIIDVLEDGHYNIRDTEIK